MEEKFIEFVADIMEEDVSNISMETTYQEFEKWDSMMMLTLILELEEEYEVSIPMESISTIKQLKDLYYLVNTK